MEKSVKECFDDMTAAYQRLIKDAEKFHEEQRRRRMTLPPTLGSGYVQQQKKLS